jgi:hypothetical protein
VRTLATSASRAPFHEALRDHLRFGRDALSHQLAGVR